MIDRYKQYEDGTSGLPRWKELWYLANRDGNEKMMKQALALRDKTEAPPTILEKAVNFTKSMVGFAKSGFKFAPEEVIKERLNICGQCPNYDNGSCRLCGCTLQAKVRIATSVCPDNPPRWGKYNEENG